MSLTFFYYFPFLVFVSYMGFKGFFSYDLLASGRVGIDIFYAVGEFVVIILSVAVLGVIIQTVRFIVYRYPNLQPPYAGRLKITGGDKFSVAFWGIINALLIALIVLAVYGRYGKPEFSDLVFSVIYLAMIAIWVNVHLGVVIYMNAKKVLGSLSVGVLLLVYIAVVYPSPLVRCMDLSLQYFGVGGGLPASMQMKGDGKVENLAGKLIFLSPENVYFLPPGVDGHILIVRRDDILKLDIQNFSGFGHRGQHSS
ncbi:hypothetical protein [Burkholderia multivorans]|uniref:hypothetical protein n=1 Tax=Burkholderia multivorans TaxID=87883 RepID=UPI001C231733|nr:hypothetical protein [Burkholderia multivorans]MBU9413493.1 hypothetical protein [Burkholderia multivorans]